MKDEKGDLGNRDRRALPILLTSWSIQSINTNYPLIICLVTTARPIQKAINSIVRKVEATEL